MIKEWIEEYHPKNEEDVLSALREIMQEIVLAALSRTDFFKKAAFYGGTALRIFHHLDRYSEDLDFSLLENDPSFTLEPYFQVIEDEFQALGFTVSIREKQKTKVTAIESTFLKSETIWKELVLEGIVKQAGIRSNKSIKIKIEVDRKPPMGFSTEELLLIRPFSFYVKCFDLPSLFAGKMHALLFRKWGNRVKGRDWYDMEWYIRKGVPLNLGHFVQRAEETGDWNKATITAHEFLHILQHKIEHVSIHQVKEDVVRFVNDDYKLTIWDKHYFHQLVTKIKFVE
ncbi:MAG: nucleotidyl transferase AbiEii/AbiGii toxin family protein [Crocinitomicaceae bacterium]|nr:nucleotidyl transferase AbiEii/AbiGii toxin family protein [Crocinitomicaceae bacterium]